MLVKKKHCKWIMNLSNNSEERFIYHRKFNVNLLVMIQILIGWRSKHLSNHKKFMIRCFENFFSLYSEFICLSFVLISYIKNNRHTLVVNKTKDSLLSFLRDYLYASEPVPFRPDRFRRSTGPKKTGNSPVELLKKDVHFALFFSLVRLLCSSHHAFVLFWPNNFSLSKN